ncbi:hypothetical protein D9619_001192 [Psilocybe cf. subviscida]|uniref:UAA transporter n=1 Tax=Psilocybe cf. subviscida TaxID=2480587 RepID=A0A8H5BCE6_9AGAR|nr:hypothetical protein D9619_001192 [Psilocybe cf. subviscida]
MLSLLFNWATTISLVFGGCCSNAVTLEQMTLRFPMAGSVLTLFQFLIISLYSLPNFVVWTRFGPRLRPRRVPISRYAIQVVIFYVISLLNNAAFAYRIPMAVHIIFRSGGLMISLLLGWLISKKSYTVTQTLSVVLVTIGVIITTLSAQPSSSKSLESSADPYTYATGIAILTVALVLAGLLGIVQDWTYATYGRPSLNGSSSGPAPWQESMFYLHFLALPMFLPLFPDLMAQLHSFNKAGPRSELRIPVPFSSHTANLTQGILPPYTLPQLPMSIFDSLVSIDQAPHSGSFVVGLSIPQIYLPLALNTITQLICASGVNRLTTGVSALTVTLVLVVRKAVSLIISVIGAGAVGHTIRHYVHTALGMCLAAVGVQLPAEGPNGEWRLSLLGMDVDQAVSLLGIAFVGPDTKVKPPQEVDNRMMWTGAALVLLGTVGYTIGSSRPTKKDKKD